MLLREDNAWSLDADCNTTIIRDAMTRQKLREIKRNMCLNNNSNLDKNDKLSKLRSYTDLLSSKSK